MMLDFLTFVLGSDESIRIEDTVTLVKGSMFVFDKPDSAPENGGFFARVKKGSSVIRYRKSTEHCEASSVNPESLGSYRTIVLQCDVVLQAVLSSALLEVKRIEMAIEGEEPLKKAPNLKYHPVGKCFLLNTSGEVVDERGEPCNLHSFNPFRQTDNSSLLENTLLQSVDKNSLMKFKILPGSKYQPDIDVPDPDPLLDCEFGRESNSFDSDNGSKHNGMVKYDNDPDDGLLCPEGAVGYAGEFFKETASTDFEETCLLGNKPEKTPNAQGGLLGSIRHSLRNRRGHNNKKKHHNHPEPIPKKAETKSTRSKGLFSRMSSKKKCGKKCLLEESDD